MFGITFKHLVSLHIYIVTIICAQEPKCSESFLAERLIERIIEVDFKVKKSFEILEKMNSRIDGQETSSNCGKDLCRFSLPTCDLKTEDVEMDGWQMVFRANSGNGHNVYNAWISGEGTTSDKPATFQRSRGLHFRDKMVPSWSSLGVKLVKFAFYDHDREVANVWFDGSGSDAVNWFHKDRVISSSYSDLASSDLFNIFSIDGDYRSDYLERRFLINRSYGGCDKDVGHLVVSDTKHNVACDWDQHPVYPQFLYSQINSADVWNRRQFGRADFMAIFIKTYN